MKWRNANIILAHKGKIMSIGRPSWRFHRRLNRLGQCSDKEEGEAVMLLIQRSMLLASILVALFVTASLAQFGPDPGIPDTVYIGGGPLVVGQSRPITLAIANDEAVAGWSLGFLLTSIDGGFARFDSAVYVGRMSDPSIFAFRINRYCACEPSPGVSPDILVTGGDKYGLNPLPAGTGEVLSFYFTGLTTGAFTVDSIFFPPAGYFILISDSPMSGLHPQFEGATIEIEESDPPPVITLPQLVTGLVGHTAEFEVGASSAVGGGVTIELVSLLGYDDVVMSPGSTPSFAPGNPASFSWSPAASDVGVWLATFQACDTAGNCSAAAVTVQILANSSFLLGFQLAQVSDAAASSGIAVANVDGDPESEFLVTGAGQLGTPEEELYSVSSGPMLDRLMSVFTGFPIYAPVSGFVDTDDRQDFVMMRWTEMAAYRARSLLSNGDNTFTEVVQGNYGHVTRSGVLMELSNDAHLDYAVTWYDGVWLYTGNSQGNFAFWQHVPTTDSATSINAGDFNQDGRNDLAIGTASGLRIYLADGNGNFVPSFFYPQENRSLEIEVTNQGSDFNNDGLLDLCISTPSVGGARSQMVAYFGNGDGSFDQQLVRDVKGQIFGNCVGDINGDGELDIVYVNGAQRYVAILYGDAGGSFTNELRISTDPYAPRHVACADVDVDGDVDLIVTAGRATDDQIVTLYGNQLNPAGYAKRQSKIDARDNAAVAVTSPSGRVVNEVRNTTAAATFNARNANLNDRADALLTFGAIEAGQYYFDAKPRPEAQAGEPFSLDYELNGVKYSLARSVVMPTAGCRFGVPLEEFSSIYPRPGQFSLANPPMLRWSVAGPHNLEIATDVQFTNVVHATVATGPVYQVPTPLPVTDTTTYYWRVKPTAASGFDCIYVLNLVAASVSCGDVDASGIVNISDGVFVVNYIFGGGPAPQPLSAGDVDCNELVSISDAVHLINFIFGGGPVPCAGCE